MAPLNDQLGLTGRNVVVPAETPSTNWEALAISNDACTAGQVIDGIFTERFPRGCLASAFVPLQPLDATNSEHPELTAAEQVVFSGLTFEKRRRDWLGGRLAGKRAILQLTESIAAEWRPHSAGEIEILTGTTREPIVYSPGLGPRSVQVSISHSGQLAGAVACYTDRGRIGFDLERLQPIEPSLYPLAFSEAEIKAIESVSAVSSTAFGLALWTAKEAVSKAVGRGLSMSLHDIQIQVPGGFVGGLNHVRLPAIIRQADLRLTIDTCWRGDYLLSLAFLEASEAQRWRRLPCNPHESHAAEGRERRGACFPKRESIRK
jgi:4'-phosphopantetheinyl transferase EntD